MRVLSVAVAVAAVAAMCVCLALMLVRTADLLRRSRPTADVERAVDAGRTAVAGESGEVPAMIAEAPTPESPTPQPPDPRRAPGRTAAEAVLPMGSYHQYLVSLARERNTTNMDIIYAHHEGFCARCGVQFPREALAHLHLAQSGIFGNLAVVGATQGGNEIRSGRCPQCGGTTLRIVTKPH